jgi:hypothetical protein
MGACASRPSVIGAEESIRKSREVRCEGHHDGMGESPRDLLLGVHPRRGDPFGSWCTLVGKGYVSRTPTQGSQGLFARMHTPSSRVEESGLGKAPSYEGAVAVPGFPRAGDGATVKVLDRAKMNYKLLLAWLELAMLG